MLKSFFLIIGLAAAGLLLMTLSPVSEPVLVSGEYGSSATPAVQESQAEPSEEPVLPVLSSRVPLSAPVPKTVIKEKEAVAPIARPAASVSLPVVSASSTVPVAASSSIPGAVSVESEPVLPPLREDELLRAVVKIECPSEDRKGIYIGSGFVMPRGVVVTAAHLLTDTGGDTCKVIFPNERAPTHYLFGTPESREGVKKRYNEQGIDVAFLFLPALAEYPEGRAVFPGGYPAVSYPVCTRTRAIGDTVFHYGYPSNFSGNSYLARNDGEAVAYADIGGVKQQLSEDQRFIYKAPVFLYTVDQSVPHPYLVSRVPSFYGDSGGLAFDATRQCILGVGHGGTIGGGAGENFSLLMMLGWEGVRDILP